RHGLKPGWLALVRKPATGRSAKMKTVMKENRVENINDVDLATYQQNNWREIDPKTGKPVPKVGKPSTESQLRQQLADLTSDLKGFYEQNAKLTADNAKLLAKLNVERDAAKKELAQVNQELAEAMKSLQKQEESK
ncbi:MAG: hypothetical protein RSC98_11265, partial [Clostridia bacterium]